MNHVAALFWLHDLWHPLNGRGYQFWSGIAGSFVTSTAWITGISVYWHRHNCHIHHCWRLAWHPDPAHGHPVCKRHHADHPKGGGNTITAAGTIHDD